MDKDKKFRVLPRDDVTRLVVAHPSRVAQADQVAAEQGIKHVELSEVAPTKYVYVFDLEELFKLPEDLQPFVKGE